ncbi:hypothetical protein LguiA_002045 [Lonicera macranthoides]
MQTEDTMHVLSDSPESNVIWEKVSSSIADKILFPCSKERTDSLKLNKEPSEPSEKGRLQLEHHLPKLLGCDKLNTDGSAFTTKNFVLHNSVKADVGGITRDSNGKWEISKNGTGIDSPHVWAALNEEIELHHPQRVITQECLQFIHNPWDCNLRFINREANKCVDLLAKMGHGLLETTFFLALLPCC